MPSKPLRARRPDVTVRPATLADLAALVRFSAAMARETEGRVLTLGRLRKGVRAVLTSDRHGRYLVAESGASVVGQLLLTYEWSDWRNGWFWWIQSVYVRPEARRHGVFRALFEHIQEAARHDPEVIGLRLYVEEGNQAAQETYFHMGLERTGYFVLEKYPLA